MGCEFCKKNSMLLSVFVDEIFEIDHCPVCGRKLEVE